MSGPCSVVTTVGPWGHGGGDESSPDFPEERERLKRFEGIANRIPNGIPPEGIEKTPNFTHSDLSNASRWGYIRLVS